MPTLTTHGSNIGHGYVKYVLNQSGLETSVIFPALVAPASDTDSLRTIPTVEVAGTCWWTGEDALLAPSPISLRSQQRLYDRHVIPALVRGALQRLNDPIGGACISGLPASWSSERELAAALGARLRDGAGRDYYHGTTLTTGLRIIAEPLGAIYGVLLDPQGQLVGDPVLERGRIGVVDLGHNTVDACIVHALTVVPDSLMSFDLGSAGPLQQLQAKVSGRYNIDLSLYEVDQAVRVGYVRVAGEPRDLPTGWDRAWIANGQQVADKLVQVWGSGAKLDAVILAGGGAELPQLVTALKQRFHHALVADHPQTAIARGYARRALRYEVMGQ